jgi:putative Mg2+ transporter-C (MgtC) family protein
MSMPLHPAWSDIALRLALTMLAGAIIGLDRGVRGHAAGFRTTILVGLAASVAMIQTNILLSLSGKTPDSFAVMDLMRLPLGILTGVGFIGGGTILKKGDLVTGVTTAATLWLVTVIGLCLGGGQLILGTIATALAVFTLQALKKVDRMIRREHRARVVLTCDATQDVLNELQRILARFGCCGRLQGRSRSATAETVDYAFELTWRGPDSGLLSGDILHALDHRFQIKRFELMTDI